LPKHRDLAILFVTLAEPLIVERLEHDASPSLPLDVR
jgi:hypothetical protein